MDLFHTITQEIENVISCHWLQEFRQTHRSHSAASSRRESRDHSADPNPRNSGDSSGPGSAIISQTNSISKLEGQKAKMSSNSKLLDTEPGGETPQYESVKTVTMPHDKESGQLEGDNASGTKTIDNPVQLQDRGEQSAENIRYGQNISESGMGGMTSTATGRANEEGGYGGTEAQSRLEKGKNPRTQQGYSAKRDDHDYHIGA